MFDKLKKGGYFAYLLIRSLIAVFLIAIFFGTLMSAFRHHDNNLIVLSLFYFSAALYLLWPILKLGMSSAGRKKESVLVGPMDCSKALMEFRDIKVMDNSLYREKAKAVIDMHEACHGHGSKQAADARFHVGAVMLESKVFFDMARVYLEEALDRYSNGFVGDGASAFTAALALINHFRERNDAAGIMRTVGKSLPALKKCFVHEPRYLITILENASVGLYDAKDYENSLRLCDFVISSSDNGPHSLMANLQFNKALVLLELDRREEAVRLMQVATDVSMKEENIEMTDVSFRMFKLAEALNGLGRTVEAESVLLQLLALPAEDGDEDSLVSAVLGAFILSDIYCASGRLMEAKELLKRNKGRARGSSAATLERTLEAKSKTVGRLYDEKVNKGKAINRAEDIDKEPRQEYELRLVRAKYWQLAIPKGWTATKDHEKGSVKFESPDESKAIVMATFSRPNDSSEPLEEISGLLDMEVGSLPGGKDGWTLLRQDVATDSSRVVGVMDAHKRADMFRITVKLMVGSGVLVRACFYDYCSDRISDVRHDILVERVGLAEA